MLAFFQGHLALGLGVVALVAASLVRRFATDEKLRSDVLGAVVWFGLFVAFRWTMLFLEERTPKEWHPLERTVWMVAFAFGTIRLVVALALWVRRRLGGSATAKIHRDVLDFVLYVVAAIPILKTQLQLDLTTCWGRRPSSRSSWASRSRTPWATSSAGSRSSSTGPTRSGTSSGSASTKAA